MRYLKGYCILLVASMAACSKGSTTTELAGNWMSRAEFRGVARSAAVAFVIDDKAYVGTGYDGEKRLQDFFVYTQADNQWKQIADFTGAARTNAIGMAIKGKGYVGTGYDGTKKLKDFLEYDPATNAWTPRAPFGGSARIGAVAFSVLDKGYVGTGNDGNYLIDMWKYDPDTDKWTEENTFNSGKRTNASAFVINDKAYVCMGTNNNSYVTDFYEFDPVTTKWKELRKIDNVSDETYDDNYNFKGSNAAAFAMNNKGYICTGLKGSGSLSTAVWEYDPVNDTWTQRRDFEGAARTDAVGFSIKNRGYVMLGSSSNLPFDNMFEFDPLATYNKND